MKDWRDERIERLEKLLEDANREIGEWKARCALAEKKPLMTYLQTEAAR